MNFIGAAMAWCQRCWEERPKPITPLQDEPALVEERSALLRAQTAAKDVQVHSLRLANELRMLERSIRNNQ